MRLSNDQMARILDTSDEWIRERSGVEQRYFASPEVATSDLGVAAAAKALERAGVAKDAVDMVVFATMTPDHYFPGCGTLLQDKLGLRSVPCFDIRQQCSGFLYGLQLADAQIRAGMAEDGAAGGRRGPRRLHALDARELRLRPGQSGTCRPRTRSSSGTRASATWWCCSATRGRRWCCARRRTASVASSTTSCTAPGPTTRSCTCPGPASSTGPTPTPSSSSAATTSP